MARFIEAHISKAALLHNLAQVKKCAPRSKILAMIKANAYGHGLARVATTLKDVDYLGVSCLEEALSIRAVGVKTDVILMEGIFHSNELPEIEKHDFMITIHHWQQIEALKAFRSKITSPLRVWLKINTGMNRLGFPMMEFAEAYQSLQSLKHIQIVGFFSHFAKADEQDDFTQKQIDRFTKMVRDKPGLKSLANSAGILAHPQSHLDVVRPGLMLYGASPFNNKTGLDLNLKPVMHLTSEVIAVQKLKAGDTVGYGGIWENKKTEGKIAIVACGYGDGYPWQAKNGAPILVNGEPAQTCGRISMDMIAIDISHLPQVNVGDKVTLWGGNLPIEHVARSAGTVAYELMCSFIERVPGRLVD